MIVTYSKPKFKFLILHNIKIHTMREDKDKRWKTGMKMQHWMHSPRHPSKNPHQFLENTLTGKERAIVERTGDDSCRVIVGSKELSAYEINLLAINDGFEGEKDFRMWFLPKGKEEWKGYILHWTDKRYDN